MNPLIIANWKCNPPTLAEAKKLLAGIKKGLGKKQKAEVVVCPPFVFISALSAAGEGQAKRRRGGGEAIKLGAQDVFWQEGAFTGEVSAKMLKDIGCKYVIVGHSERRALGETDEMVNKKIKAAISAKLSPILCIGESEEQRKQGKTKKVLERQLTLGLKGVSSFKFQDSGFAIAYEPIWAIGTGKSCDLDTAMTMNLLIRKTLANIYNRKVSQKVRVLYGGSVNPENAFGYIEEARMDGLLVGGASLDAKKFVAILKKF